MTKVNYIKISSDSDKKFVQLKRGNNIIAVYGDELNDLISELEIIQKDFKIVKYKPIEIGIVYKTKMSDGISFKIEEIKNNIVYGYYVGLEHLGICPLSIERLNPEQL